MPLSHSLYVQVQRNNYLGFLVLILFFLKTLLWDFTPNCWAGYLSCLTTLLCFLPSTQWRNVKDRHSRSYKRRPRDFLAGSEPKIHLPCQGSSCPAAAAQQAAQPCGTRSKFSHTKRHQNHPHVLEIHCHRELLLFPLCWCKPDECFQVQTSPHWLAE